MNAREAGWLLVLAIAMVIASAAFGQVRGDSAWIAFYEANNCQPGAGPGPISASLSRLPWSKAYSCSDGLTYWR